METISINATIKAPVDRVWKCYTTAEDITQWNFASDDWCCPRAQNDLRMGGSFSWRMEAKDGSFGFDFSGTYEEVQKNRLIAYTIGDGRKVRVTFTDQGSETKIMVSFEAENQNALEMQRGGWQAILQNFKKYVEK